MPQGIKFNSTSVETKSLRSGNIYFGIGDDPKGPTTVTGFKSAVDFGTSISLIALHRGDGVFSWYKAFTEQDIITFTNKIDLTGINLITNNPRPITNTTGYAVSGGQGTLTFDSEQSAIRWLRTSYEAWGAYIWNNSIQNYVFDKFSNYTVTFEWKFGPSHTANQSYNFQIINGPGSYTILGNVGLTANSIELQDGWQRFTRTHRPLQDGVGQTIQYRIITGNPGGTTDIFWRKLEYYKTTRTTKEECYNYFAGQSDKIIFNKDYDTIVTDGLVLNFDAGFLPSYPGTGTTWFNLSGETSNGTLQNEPTFDLSSGASLVTDGINDGILISPFPNIPIKNSTLTIVFDDDIQSGSRRLFGQSSINTILWTKNESEQYFRINSVTTTLSFPIQPSGIKYLTLTIDDNYLVKFYNRGNLVTEQSFSGGAINYMWNAGIGSANLGYWTEGPSQFSKYKYYQLLLYSRDINTDEVVQNYSSYLYSFFENRVRLDGGLVSDINKAEIKTNITETVSSSPSLLLVPSMEKEGKLYTVLPFNGTGDFTVSRDGTATYFDKDGLLKTAAANEPRLDFDPLTGEYKGVLVEPAETNLFLYSEKFEESVWLNSDSAGIRVFKTDNQAIAPNGTLTAGLIRPSSLPNVEHPMRYSNTNISSSIFQNPFSWSIFVKPAGYNFFGLRTNVNNVWSLAMWNLQTGAPFSISNNYTNSFIQKLPNGWYRVGVTAPNSTITSIQHISSPNGSISFTGNEVDGTYVWGAQLKTGTIATSYIPTTGSQVIRPADSITVPSYSSLFGTRNTRLFVLDGETRAVLNGEDFQLPTGHNKLTYERSALPTSAEIVSKNIQSIQYGLQQNIKDDYKRILDLNPSLIMIAAKGATGSLQTIFPNDGTGDIGFTRAGTSFHIQQNNQIKSFASGVPIFDYTTNKVGFRLFSYNENFLLRSEDLSNQVWIKVGVSVTNAELAPPIENAVGSRVTATEANATIRQTRSFSNRVSLFSIFVRKVSGTGNLQIETSGNVKTITATSEYVRYQVRGYRLSGNFTANNGLHTVTTSASHNLKVSDVVRFNSTGTFTGPNVVVTSIIDATTFTFNSGSSTSSGTCNIVGNYVNITIPNSGDVFEIVGAQVNGTVFANLNDFRDIDLDLFDNVGDYIRTVASEVNRPAEIIDRTLSGLFNSDNGTFFMEFAITHPQNGFYRVVTYFELLNTDGTVILRMENRSNHTNFTNFFRWVIAPTSQNTSDTTISQFSTIYRVALKFGPSSLKYFVNGSLINTITITTAMNLNLNRFRNSGNSMVIHTIAPLKKDLTDQEAIALTTL